MGRLALAALLVASVAGVATAGPTRKVAIDTEPPGATIYLDDVEKGPVCEETPCTFTSPLGTHTLIFRLDKYEPDFMEIDVTKGKRPQDIKKKLKSALGTIVVDTPKGALVRVNQEDSGKAPTRVAVSSAEGHHVVVTLNGKTLFDEFVEVATGDEYVVKTRAGGVSTAAASTSNEDDEDGEGDGPEIEKSAPSKPRAQFLTVALAVDVGFREFTYDTPETSNLRPESEAGQTMAGPAIEFFPGRLAGIKFLRGLSLFGRYQFNVLGQNVTGVGLTGPVKTAWESFEASLRQRWMIASETIGLEASVGYVDDAFRFGGADADVMLMPAAHYQSLRVGGKLLYDAGVIEPYLSGENRIVFSGGTLENRFTKADSSGLRGALGVVLEFKPFLWARVEGALMNYSWKFTSDTGDPYRAKGATDSVKLISILAAYTY